MDPKGLKRVVLVDSYLSGVYSEVKVDGHTTLTGINGAGKTSFLKLLPIFYGGNPSEHVKSDDVGNWSFAKFYLPKADSYIVFEYLTHTGMKTVVFTSVALSENHYRQIFIDAPLDLSLFVDLISKVPLDSSDLVSRIVAGGYTYKAVKTNKEYRRLLLESGHSQYSLANHGASLATLTPLLSSMFKKEASFNDLAIVIQDWCLKALRGDAQRILDSFTLNKSDIDKFLLDFDATTKVTNLEPKATLLVNSIQALENVARDLSAIKVVARKRSSQNSALIDTSNKAIVAAEKALSDEGDRWAITSKATQEAVDDSHHHVSLSTRKINDLNSRKLGYDESGVPGFEAKIAQIPDTEKAIQRQQVALARLTDEAASVELAIATERAVIETNASTYLESLQSAENASNTQHAEQIGLLESQKEGNIASFNAETQAWERDNQIKLDDAKETALTIKANLGVAAASVETVNKVAESLAMMRSKHADKDEQSIVVASAKEKVKSLKAAYKEKEDDLSFVTSTVNKINDDIARLVSLRDGEPGTLVHLLNAHRPNWQQTIGKVVKEDVLLSKRLSPSLDETGDANSFFGINLNFDTIRDGIEAAEDIPLKIQALSELAAKEAEEERLANKALTAAQKELLAEMSRVTEAEAAFKRLERDVEQLNAAYDRMVFQENQEKEANQKRLGTQLIAADQFLATLKEGHVLYLKDRTEKRAGLVADHDKRIATAKGANTALKLDYKAQREQALITKRAELVRLDQALADALKGKGVDPETVKAVEKDITTLKAALATARSMESKFSAYSDFMANEYSTLPKLKQEGARLAAELTARKAVQSTQLAEHNATCETLRDNRKENENKVTLLVADNNKMKSHILSDEGLTGSLATADKEDVDRWSFNEVSTLIIEHSKASSELANHKRTVAGFVNEFSDGFKLKPGSVCDNYWTESMGDNSRAPTEIARSIVHYYASGEHSDNVSSVVQRLQFLSNIDTYRRHIVDFESGVRSFNRKLNQCIGETMAFKAVTDIQVSLTFQPHKLEHWRDIEAVSKHYEKWVQDDSGRKIPSDAFIHSLREFAYRLPSTSIKASSTDLWRQINFCIDLIENGHKKRIDTENGLRNTSSNGLSYLILIVLFLGFIDIHRQDKTLSLAWSLDELGNIDDENTLGLLNILSERNVHLVSACPSSSFTIQSEFKYRFEFESKNNKTVIIDRTERIKIKSPFIKQQEQA